MKRLFVVCTLLVALLLATGAAPAAANQYDGCVKYEATLGYAPGFQIYPIITATTGYLYVSWPADHSLPATGLGKNAGQWNPQVPPYSDHNIEGSNGSRRGFRQQTMGYSQVFQYDFTVNGQAHQCKWFGWMAVGGPDGGTVYSVTWIYTSY